MHADADNDLLIVRELRKMSSLSKRSEKIAPRAADEQLKWLDWPDFVRVQASIFAWWTCIVIALLIRTLHLLLLAHSSCFTMCLKVASISEMWGTGG